MKLDQPKTQHLHILFTTLVFFILVIAISRISIFFIAPHPTGGFPYFEYASRDKLPEYLKFLTNFDGTQYLIIAESGYFTYQQAYFPMYPLVSGILAKIFFGNTPLIMISLSLICLVFALHLLTEIYKSSEFHVFDRSKPHLALCILLLPGSFFFVAAYTESIFLLIFLASLFFTKSKNMFFSIITGISLGLTRLVGVFGVLIMLAQVYKEKNRVRAMLIALSPLLGLVIYMTYLFITTSDPLAFINSQKAFNNNRSTSIILLPQVIYRYLKIIITVRNFDTVYLVSVIEFVLFCLYSALLVVEAKTLMYFWKLKKVIYETRLSLLIFSVINLILPTFTGTLSSIPRYGLMSLSIVPAIFTLNRHVRNAILLLLTTINIIMLMLFAQGWFVS